MYGVIDREKNVACDRAPPGRISSYSTKFPPVAALLIQEAMSWLSRNGTVMALPTLKMIMINSV